MKKVLRQILVISASALAGLTAMAGLAHGSDSVRLETLKTHSRLSIRLDDGVTSEWKPSPQGFELFLKGIGLADLGAPLGEESQWLAQFQALKDPRLSQLTFTETRSGLRVEGAWKYPEGKLALAEPRMETFDYREKKSSELVIDFWVKEGPTVTQVHTKHEASRRLASVQKREDEVKLRNARRLAREQARVRAEDPELFCRAPLNEDNDVFMQFVPVHEPMDLTRWVSATTPDSDFSYYEPKGKARDAQYVRLALKLYKEENFALVNRTLDFFDKEFPKSTYRTETRFLRANAFLKLGLKDEGMRQLKDMLYEEKASPETLHIGMFIASQQFTQGNFLGALETFSWLGNHHAENRMSWVFHLGAAESARALKQTERAAHEYEWVADNAPEVASQAEGALRTGDLFMERYQYEQGLAAYSQAARHFKEEAAAFPSVQINRAEALYGLGQFDRAAVAFEGFLKRFSGHPYGWRAAYRLGEIEARKAGASRASEPARKWYLETINRFPFSPGATLARLQLMSCGDHAGFTPEAAKRFFEGEAETFDGSGEVSLARYKDFRALAHVRTLMTLGQQQEAVATAIEELRRLPEVEARRWLGNLLAMNFRKSVLALLSKGSKLEALTFYEQHSDTVPRGDSTVDPDYLLKLSLAASDLNLGKLAQDLNTEFEKARKMQSHTGTGRALASGSKAEDMGDPEIRMEHSERAFTEAKALWTGSGAAEEKRIRAALAGVGEESRYSYERELILGLLDEKHGQHQAALKHAARAQILGPRNARVDAWVASLEARAGDPRAALAAYRALEKDLSRKPASNKSKTPQAPEAAEIIGVPAVPAREAMILAQSEILEKQGRWGEAAANYTRAVQGGLGGSQALYGYARALLKSGGKDNHAKAIATLEKLAAQAADDLPKKGAPAPEATAVTKPKVSDKDTFWRKLASETLANEKTAEVTKNNAKEGI
jgi:TolA-binding protein